MSPFILFLLPWFLLGLIIWSINRAYRKKPQRISEVRSSKLPQRNYFYLTEELVRYYWSRAFYENLTNFVEQGCPMRTKHNCGLIYYYAIDDEVRYIGQTRENSLKRRMTKPQKDGKIGYGLRIKRNMLQAASEGRLIIFTQSVPINQLDAHEKTEIQRYAITNKLWNQEHNPYFKPENFNYKWLHK